MSRRSVIRSLSILVFAAAAVSPAVAQLSLDKVGGALGGTTTFTIQGPATTPYWLLFSAFEQQTTILGVTLDIPLDNLDVTLAIPGFTGATNGAGLAQFGVTIPNIPALAGFVVSMQAAAGPPFVVSNLIRLSLAESNTFAPALNQPAVPIAGGGTAAAPNGGLLFVGGSGPVAQSYNSRVEEWEASGSTFGVGLFSQTTGLADGRVLFTGGLGLDGQPTNAAAVYDPVTQTTTTLTMNAARAGHGASLLGNGKVLVTGGFATFSLTDILSFFTGIQGTTEVFDPATMAFSNGPTLLEPRSLHTSTTLSNGQVVIAGGITLIPIINIPTVSATAYRYNPATNSFGFPSTMGGARFLHSATALANGKVLIAGGATLDLTGFITTGDITAIAIGTLTDCQVYTPNIIGGSFATVSGLSEGRAGAGLATLPNGDALIAGGVTIGIDVPNSQFVFTPIASADRFVASNSTIVPVGSMSSPRFLPVTAALPDATILVVGGGGDAEIFQP